MAEQLGTPWLRCHVRITCEESLEELAGKISSSLLGGIKFNATPIYDEVPCMQLNKDILGLRVLLYGLGGEQGFEFKFRPETWKHKDSGDETDMSHYIAEIVRRLLNVKVVVMEYPKTPPLSS